jgi:hypothetical protein
MVIGDEIQNVQYEPATKRQNLERKNLIFKAKKDQCQNQKLNHAGLPLGASVLLCPYVCTN